MKPNNIRDFGTLYKKQICDSEDEWVKICTSNRKRLQRLWQKIEKVKNEEPDINLIKDYTVDGSFNFATGIIVCILCIICLAMYSNLLVYDTISAHVSYGVSAFIFNGTSVFVFYVIFMCI